MSITIIDTIRNKITTILRKSLIVDTPPPYEAGLQWFDGKNFNFYDNIVGTSIQLGRELLTDAHNNTGATIPNLSVVRYEGTIVEGVPVMALAQANTVANCNSVAVVTHNIADGENGKVVFNGNLGGDTSAWSVGDRLYVSATVPGGLTNVEQEILSLVAIVLVADVDGLLLVNPKGVTNLTALGQARGQSETQDLTITPVPLEVYGNTIFEINTLVTLTGASPYTAAISPAIVGATGYYRVAFNISISSNYNGVHTFEAYVNGSPTGILGIIDLTNNNIDAGNCSLSAVTGQKLTDSDTVEIYAYAGGNATIIASSVSFNMERIGIV